MADKSKMEQYPTRPKEMGKWEGFKAFLWNSETSECLGRTGSSWAKILIFYVIFYAVLAGFFAAMLAVFYQTLDSEKPKWKLTEGLIGNNPGLGFRPMPEESNVESTLIWFESSDKNNIKHWTQALDKFTQTYRNNSIAHKSNMANPDDCVYGKKRMDGKVCPVDVDKKFSRCTSDNNFGYASSSPCIFLKLNKIFDWEPEFYKDEQELPPQMPEDLKEHIKGLIKDQKKELETIWISCEGENPADIENIGPIQYFPQRGFPGFYYPFKNQKGYLAPTMAVFFERPKTGVLINIECKAWAKNIVHDRTDRRGSVHFELMVD